MFCYQCQETAKNTGCTIKGVCGKNEETANLQDLLIFALKGLSVYGEKAKGLGVSTGDNGLFVTKALFTTVTNANFDDQRLTALIQEALAMLPQVPPEVRMAVLGQDPTFWRVLHYCVTEKVEAGSSTAGN